LATFLQKKGPLLGAQNYNRIVFVLFSSAAISLFTS